MAEIIFVVIAAIFILMLFINKMLTHKFCAICVSIFLAWSVLFALNKFGLFKDGILIGLLMGQSISGAYYALRSRVNRSMLIFTLPFFLTTTVIAYSLLTNIDPSLSQLLFMLAIWIISYTIFVYRNDPGKKAISDAVMNCCGDK